MKKNLQDGNREYEYECNKCGETTILKRAVESRDNSVYCENCGSKNTSRKFSLSYVKVN